MIIVPTLPAARPGFSGEVIGQITGVGQPSQLAVNAAGTKLYVTGSAGIVVVDTATGTAVKTIPEGQWAGAITVTPSGKVYFASGLTSGVGVLVNDTYTKMIYTPGYAMDVVPSVDGTRLYAMDTSQFWVIDTADDSHISTDPNCGGVSGVATATNVYISSNAFKIYRINDNNYGGTISGEISGLGKSARTTTKVYAAAQSGVNVLDIATHTLLPNIPTGGNCYGMAVSADGTRAYATSNVAKSLSVIDTATDTITKTVTGFGSIYGVAAHPDGTKVYVADQVNSTVTVIG